MIEPTIALQTAIRDVLIATPAVTALVPADHIRAGSTRPDRFPCIIMSDGTTVFHCLDAANQRAVWVHLDLHVWTLDAGQDAAKTIAFAVRNALDKAPPIDWGTMNSIVVDCAIDSFAITRVVYPRDPDPKYGHGVLSVEALMRWTI